jgi:hypothetical protein
LLGGPSSTARDRGPRGGGKRKGWVESNELVEKHFNRTYLER